MEMVPFLEKGVDVVTVLWLVGEQSCWGTELLK